MTIEYYTKSVYGNDNMYVANEEIATYVSWLTNKKTISTSDMEALTKLGHNFTEVLAPKK